MKPQKCWSHRKSEVSSGRGQTKTKRRAKKNRSNHGKKREKRFFTGKSTLRLKREGSPHTEIRWGSNSRLSSRLSPSMPSLFPIFTAPLSSSSSGAQRSRRSFLWRACFLKLGRLDSEQRKLAFWLARWLASLRCYNGRNAVTSRQFRATRPPAPFGTRARRPASSLLVRSRLMKTQH